MTQFVQKWIERYVGNEIIPAHVRVLAILSVEKVAVSTGGNYDLAYTVLVTNVREGDE